MLPALNAGPAWVVFFIQQVEFLERIHEPAAPVGMKTGRGRHGALFLESHAPLDEVGIGANHERGFVPRFGFRITPGPHFRRAASPFLFNLPQPWMRQGS